VQDISLTTNRRRYAKSSSFMMALLFTVLCGAVAVTLGYFINYFAKGHLVHSAQAVIDSEIKYIETLGDIPPQPVDDSRLYIPLDSNAELPASLSAPQKFYVEGLLVLRMPENDKRYAARVHTLHNDHKIMVATDITDMANDYDFMQWIGIASIAFVMIVVFVSYIISIFVVNGTNNIASTAYDIIHTGDLSRRVEVSARWDDLSNVGVVLNLLLDRIEELMHGVRQVSDNIAHDLRTPLTRMRSHIDALQKRQPEHEEYAKLLNEADQILSTFNALLRISRIETEQQRSQFQVLDIDTVLKDVIEFYEPLAEDKHITINCDIERATLHGDRDLLFQAFANIIDNAIKYTPEDGIITLNATKQDNAIHIRIENSSVMVDEHDLPKLFHRFYRADKSRSQQGTGLGLSLVAAVIKLHNGTVSAHNTPNGFQIITQL